MSFRDDPRHLFTLHVKLSSGLTLIAHAFEGAWQAPNHTRLDVEASLLRKSGSLTTREPLWPRGATWCGIPGHQSIDGEDAKALVLSLLSMKPGDTDADFFAGWTPEQLAFANAYGEELSLVSCDRYGER